MTTLPNNIPDDNNQEQEQPQDFDDTTESKKKDIIFVPDVSRKSSKHRSSTSLQIRNGNDEDERSQSHDILLNGGRTTCSRTFQLSLSSNILFVVASIFYLYLSVMDLNYAHSLISQSNSDETTAGDDDSFGSDDTYGAAATAVDDDDDAWVYVFAVKSGSGTWVSLYQIIYFLAALFFVLSGVVNFLLKPGFLSVTLILAGAFGVVSAMLMEEYEYLSNVFNSVSVHLFMIEAVGLFLHPHPITGTQQQFLQRFVQFGSLSWIGGTLIDVVLSYFSFFGQTTGAVDTIPFAIVGTLSSTLWLTCSLIYLTTTCMAECQVRRKQAQPQQQTEGISRTTTTTIIKAADTVSASSTSEDDEEDSTDMVYVEV